VAGVADDAELAELPFTTKAELLDQYPYGLLAVPLEQTVRLHASSGTRHKPTIVAYTARDVEIFADVNARSIACAGGTPEDVLHVAYGYGLFTGGLGLHYGGERLGATVVPASGGNSGFQVQLLADLGARGICCTPSFCYLLAERAREEGVLDRIRLEYGVLGAEPWSEALRQKVEEAWGEFDACDIYGLSEVIGPGVAMECREGKGALHVFDDHFLPEVVDPATGAVLPSGREGELVLTALTKRAMPMIRYRTGDITTLTDAPCRCGRTSTRMARVKGRSDDMLIIKGVNLYPSEVEATLLGIEELVPHYQLLVDRTTTLARLEVQVEPAPAVIERCGGFDPGHPALVDLQHRVGQRLSKAIGLTVELSLVAPRTVPRSEGKAVRVVEKR
jgi:phenylacetate-CoA ligase